MAVAMLEVSRAPCVPPGARELIGEGASVVVATRDSALRPHIARGWGVELLDECGPARLCVAVPDGSPTATNLDCYQEIAVTIAQPSTYRSVQMKGIIVELGQPDDEQLRRVEQHAAAFSDDVERVGISARLVKRFLDRSALVSVTLELEELYDQTPGPAAGRPLTSG